MRRPAADLDNLRARPLLERLAGFVDRTDLDTTYLTHGIHPYPAKYIPQLPRLVIEEHTNERSTILDPFCGSGTSLLEGAILGRKSIGVDSNPIAALVSRAKTQALGADDFVHVAGFGELLKRTCERGGAERYPVPPIPRIEHWFQANVIHELAWLRHHITLVTSRRAQDLLACVFSSIVTAVSNQESDTRYAARQKDLPDGFALNRYLRKLESVLPRVRELSSISAVRRNTPRVLQVDAASLTESHVAAASIDLIVTSPPYPNSYDYYLYHKLRMFWLGYDPREAQDREIGSRHEHSSKREPIQRYEARMLPVMRQISRVLKPAKLAYLFVGDAIIAGEVIDVGDVFRRIAAEADLGFVAEAAYDLAAVTRSFNEKRWSSNRNKASKLQRVVVFEARGRSRGRSPNARSIAPPSALRTPIQLEGSVPDGASVALASDDTNRHVHSLGKYPSKFIPDIPRWCVEQYSQPGARVLDPFAGSGTTAVEAMLLGRDAIASDVSPFACLLARAKTTRFSVEVLERLARRLEHALSHPDVLPSAPRLSFEWDAFWFNPEHLAEFARIRRLIEDEFPEAAQPFFLAMLASTIKSFSFLDESQIKVKRDPKKVLSGTPAPGEVLRKRLPGHVERLRQFWDRSSPETRCTILNTSAELLDDSIERESVDLIVTSPPYINAMNYPMAHRYENLLLGLVPVDKYNEHQRAYFGTERVYAREFKEMPSLAGIPAVEQYLQPRIEEIFGREPKRAYIAASYFGKMAQAFTRLVPLLRPGGRFVLVAGTNTIRDVHLDTFSVLMTLLAASGLARVTSFHYEIIKNAFKLRRHETARLIPADGVGVLEKP